MGRESGKVSRKSEGERVSEDEREGELVGWWKMCRESGLRERKAS